MPRMLTAAICLAALVATPACKSNAERQKEEQEQEQVRMMEKMLRAQAERELRDLDAGLLDVVPKPKEAH